MFTIGIRREQAQGIAVDVLKDYRRELLLSEYANDFMIEACTLLIDALDQGNEDEQQES